MEGSSNYAFNVVLQEPDMNLRDRIEDALDDARIEYRRGSAGGGNQMRQPYLRELVAPGEWLSYPEVEHIHFFGWYIGNFPGLAHDRIKGLCRVLNNA